MLDIRLLQCVSIVLDSNHGGFSLEYTTGWKALQLYNTLYYVNNFYLFFKNIKLFILTKKISKAMNMKKISREKSVNCNLIVSLLSPCTILLICFYQSAIDSDMGDRIRRQREQDYECVISTCDSSDQSTSSLSSWVHQYTLDREARIKQFLHHVNSKRLHYFQELVNRKKTVGVWWKLY